MTTSPGTDVVLHQIDKIYDNLAYTKQTMNRIGILGVVLSLIMIALSFGLVSAGQQLSVIGLTLTVPLWLFILGGTWIIGVLFVYYHVLDAYDDKLANRIVELYSSIGYTDENMDNFFPKSFNFILMTTFPKLTMLKKSDFNKVIVLSITLVIALFIIFIPLIAQIIAYYKVVSLVGGIWWVILSLCLQFLITVPYAIAIFTNAPTMSIDIFDS